ncbi:hypothetical protein KUC85_01240 [Pseudomonas aeruginosa]|uniref:hypothetical protein n=1 Tax=Pseudomonas aeruginosa TaxID=287 RepID=UPI000D00BEA3|nr:hypothetical protein [Pseudomonas aeruginosa]MBH4429373.1 hypothetical protein [Pseudomonas aeruginosa]MBH4482670.1 hypothetical protein [Pseudomonas aeruginosa]MCV0027225.1 hypothetical protein [Pseudomonas aeruginosa]MDY1062234.1 hypothetical protein [Pseudomonas aeruginosa]RUI41284.1 hypothetical protein IPC414_07775 [Pseudomonas aeruginosa]
MASRCVGLVVTASDVTVVDTTIPDDQDAPLILNRDDTWKLAGGDRAKAYETLFHRCTGYIQENGVDQVVIKASALPQGGGGSGVLGGAELRGVIMCAAASVSTIRVLEKSWISRTYKRKVDDVVKDDDFWEEQLDGAKLRKGSREAAMLVVAHRNRP